VFIENLSMPPDACDRVRAAAISWAAINGGELPSNIKATPTTLDVAVRALQGEQVSADALPIYLVVMVGKFYSQGAVDAGASSAPSGTWVALFMSQETLDVVGYILRPNDHEASVSHSELGDFILIYSR